MRKKSKVSQADLLLFHETMKGTKPLKNKSKISLTQKTTTQRREAPESDPFPVFPFSDWETLDPVTGDTFISFARNGISHKVLRNLSKGQYNTDAILDLHRMTVAQAREAVTLFLAESVAEKARVVLIIHGKGRPNQLPILKNKLNHWLREVEFILAFCSAASKHGSRGALYVLLKRVQGENLLD
jgi:DNA-nicking Smr family endonuclease